MTSKSILIIDDEMEVCTLLGKYLARNNKSVDYSTTLNEGIEKFKKMKPDLLILDNNIPDGYGIENIATFRKLMNEMCVIVIISAMSNLKSEALEKGADYFLEKPISFGTLNTILLKN